MKRSLIDRFIDSLPGTFLMDPFERLIAWLDHIADRVKNFLWRLLGL